MKKGDHKYGFVILVYRIERHIVFDDLKSDPVCGENIVPDKRIYIRSMGKLFHTFLKLVKQAVGGCFVSKGNRDISVSRKYIR